jgi:hypothetical protein
MHYVPPVRLVTTVEPKTLKLMTLLTLWLAAQRPAAKS